MPLGILGNKIGMTQIVDELGNLVPVTILRAGPCTVTQIKTVETDGYNAVQIGYAQASSKVLNKPQIGHLERVGVPLLRYLHEYKVNDTDTLTLGEKVGVDLFSSGNLVDVTGKSIGKGFAGIQKRHNFGRGPMTHGSKNHRAPGSIGAASYPARVFKGMRMAGQMGNARVTIENLEVLKVLPEQGVLVVKGAVPGHKGATVVIHKPQAS